METRVSTAPVSHPQWRQHGSVDRRREGDIGRVTGVARIPPGIIRGRVIFTRGVRRGAIGRQGVSFQPRAAITRVEMNADKDGTCKPVGETYAVVQRY